MHRSTNLCGEAFDRWSSNGTLLTRHEFKCAFMQLFGTKPSKAHWQLLQQGQAAATKEALLKASDNEDATVSREQFVAAMQALLQGIDPNDHVRSVFKAFDVRCAGYISRDDAHAVFRSAAPSVSHRVVDEVFDELDMDRDGRVSCSDFMHMMRIRVG